jgi:hypothetical protein
MTAFFNWTPEQATFFLLVVAVIACLWAVVGKNGKVTLPVGIAIFGCLLGRGIIGRFVSTYDFAEAYAIETWLNSWQVRMGAYVAAICLILYGEMEEIVKAYQRKRQSAPAPVVQEQERERKEI